MARLLLTLPFVLALLSSCGDGGGDVTPTAGSSSPPAGTFVRECGTEIGSEFDAGLESRMVAAGPVSFVPFRVSPVPNGDAPMRGFKIQVRTEAGNDCDSHHRHAGDVAALRPSKFRRTTPTRWKTGRRASSSWAVPTARPCSSGDPDHRTADCCAGFRRRDTAGGDVDGVAVATCAADLSGGATGGRSGISSYGDPLVEVRSGGRSF
jgi:hypothetical protein